MGKERFVEVFIGRDLDLIAKVLASTIADENIHKLLVVMGFEEGKRDFFCTCLPDY